MKPLNQEISEILSHFESTRGGPALAAIQTEHDCGNSRGLPLLLAVARELTFSPVAAVAAVTSTPPPTPPKPHEPKKSFQDLVKELAIGKTTKPAAIAAAIDQRPDLYSEYLSSGGGSL